MGWLANQMFQYAATYAISLHRGVRCGFPANKPNLHEVFRLSGHMSSIPNRSRYVQPSFQYDPAFWDLPDGTELSGYFQSEKFFAPYAEQIRREFQFPLYRWPKPDAVSIHVRRGDYLSFPEHHPPLTMDYYREAMSRFPGARFLVFSDDPGWCLLNFDRQTCEISTGRTAAEDMALMAACDHHIIGNSSFSWWAGYLGRNPKKRVIAPANRPLECFESWDPVRRILGKPTGVPSWFGPAKDPEQWSTRDLIPAGWERI